MDVKSDDHGGCRVLMQSARVQTSDKTEQILKYFTEVDGKLRLVIATTAFGMDIDCPDVQSLALGNPENGRARKDGDLSVIVLYIANEEDMLILMLRTI